MASVTAASQPVQSVKRKPLSWLATTLIFLNTMLLGLVVWAYACFGSIQGAMSYVRGQYLIVDEYNKSCGAIEPGQHKVVSFLLTNHDNVPIRILGCQTSCNCRVDELPLFSIGPKQSRSFRIIVQPSEKDARGPLRARVAVYTNNPTQPMTELAIVGKLVERVESLSENH